MSERSTVMMYRNELVSLLFCLRFLCLEDSVWVCVESLTSPMLEIVRVSCVRECSYLDVVFATRLYSVLDFSERIQDFLKSRDNFF